MMCAYPDRYGDEITEALKIAATRDTTDLKRAYTLKIQAIQADDLQRQELIKVFMSGNHEWSIDELTASIKGFTSSHIPTERKSLNYDYYFDNLVESMRKLSIATSEVILRSFNISLGDI